VAGKQAVVIIHGIGEQKPMDTLRGFVSAVWTSHKEIHLADGDSLWSKPDSLSESFDLRRLTTSQNTEHVRTDFFEFYWAHMMEGTTYGHVGAWAQTLLVRSPGSVPKQLKPVYWFLVLLLVVAIAVLVRTGLQSATETYQGPKWPSMVLSLIVLPLVGFVVLKVIGDAARYLHVGPDNIKGRAEIRKAGVELLKQLHEPERGYDRIILVGHSLGSVIGYDILTNAWPDFSLQHSDDAKLPPSLNDLEALAAETPAIDDVRRLQRKYNRELRERGCKWLVTDFVTMGSPLTHAAILLAKDLADLRLKQNQREFPTCLPTLEKSTLDGKPIRRFSFFAGPSRAKDAYRQPHHAAMFAATRWTNLYFPCRAVIKGDVIGGPLRDVMGIGIKDVPVTTKKRGGFLNHTDYWTQSPGERAESHIEALREAVNLLDR